MHKSIKSGLISRRVLAMFGAAGAVLAMAGLAPVQAQEWPSRPITFLNPFPAGGGTDAFARPLAAQLDTQLNQRVIVENRGGAGGTVGAAAAAQAAPDGYTFFIGAAHHTIAPSIYPKLSYDLEKDFIPVGVIAMPPQVISLSPKARPDIKTLKQLIDYAKANPGKLNYASAGNGTTHHLAGEFFKRLAGVDLVHVPYRGAGPAMQDLVAGKVDVMFDGLGTSAPQIKGGNLIGLGVAAAKRTPSAPDVPTAAEAGLKGYEVSTWYAMWAVKGTPPAIVARMQAELKKALANDKIKSIWVANGSDIPDIMGDDFGKFVTSEIARWGKVVKDSNVKLQ